MKFLADLHIHSHYSRATSRQLNLEQIYKYAQLKGIQVVGTGDITHPGWLDEIRKKLEPAEDGLFQLKREYANKIQEEVPKACQGEVRFILSGEISSIYKKADRVRKNHNVVFFPSIEIAQKFQSTLEKIGNIRSDGRPILGLDARNLLELVLESNDLSYLIPAHIWTPWFSVLGSKSGFDSIEECFDDLTPYIFALETGLSSDPPMNWRLSKLDKFVLVSNSDAHSPAKLAREANLFKCELSYSAMLAALKSPNTDEFLGTVEFFPEEGKYHLDGHRKCSKRMTPEETIANKGICSVCGKKVTVGVLYRVEELADRAAGFKPNNAKQFYSLIPLPEVLSEILNVGPNTKTVNKKLDHLLTKLGSELTILFDLPLTDIEKIGGALLAEGIRRIRAGDVKKLGGYDGEFGTITLFTEKEKTSLAAQSAMFQYDASEKKAENREQQNELFIIRDKDEAAKKYAKKSEKKQQSAADELEDENGLNRHQREAVNYDGDTVLIVAGPGTGKTRTLTYRIAHLVNEKKVSPDQILAITFTNRAADEMRDRLNQLVGQSITKKMTIKTFHALGAHILRNEAETIDYPSSFSIYTEDDKLQLLRSILPVTPKQELRRISDQISDAKNKLLEFTAAESLIKKSNDDNIFQILQKYQNALKQNQAFDFEDLIVQPIKIFKAYPEKKQKYQEKYLYIFVDEYQDINFAQYFLLRQLTFYKTKLCVIGDPNQAIYGFRGSDRRYFLQFEKDFPETKTIRLEKNYRSDSTIIDASTQVMAKSPDFQDLSIYSTLITNTRIDIFQTPTEKSEAETIVHQIEQMVGATSFFSVDSGRAGAEESEYFSSFSDIAVLFRVKAQLVALEEAFIRSGIPYQTLGEIQFFEIPAVDDVISFLKVLQNPNSDVYLLKTLNKPPRGIGEQTVQTLSKYQHSNSLTFWQSMESCHRIALLSETQKQPVENFVKKINKLHEKNGELTVGELIEAVLKDFGFRSYYKNDQQRQYYWMQLLSMVENYSNNLDNFLEDISLQSETDIYEPKSEKVTLLTLHAAKGLEFPVVFITGCEDGLIPYFRQNECADLEEERRLFYVGMTRAKLRLILLHSKSRFLFGKRSSNSPSRFLNQIETALKENRQAEIKEKRKSKSEISDDFQLKLF